MVKTATPPSTDQSQPKYTGVRKRKWGKWVSEIRLPNSRERIWLGSYDSPEKAARAFDAALYCLRGRNAKFNFPHNPPEIAGGESLSPHSIQAVAARFANESTPTPATTAEVTGEQPSAQVDSEIDWSFLDMLDGYKEVGREFGYYSDGYYPPEPRQASVLDDDQDGDCHQSFLWNFNE